MSSSRRSVRIVERGPLRRLAHRLAEALGLVPCDPTVLAAAMARHPAGRVQPSAASVEPCAERLATVLPFRPRTGHAA